MKILSRKCCTCSDGNDFFYKKIDEHVLHKCKTCSIVFLKDITKKDTDFIPNAIDENIEYWSTPHLFQKYKELFESFFQIRINRIKKYAPSGLLLDIGSGYGFWQKYVNQNGFVSYGIEPDRSCFDYATNELTLENFFQTRFEDFEQKDLYDVITLVDVLEHFDSPYLTLRKVHKLLYSKGIIFIQVPDVLGFKIPLMHNLGLPFHLWQFNKKSMTNLLNKSGFELLEYWTGVQGVVGKYESGGPSLIDKAKWSIARKIKRGNRLQIIARKV